MNLEMFKRAIIQKIPEGTILKNPLKGVTEIVSYTDDKIEYRRGEWKPKICFYELYNAVIHYQGKCLSSRELTQFSPVFAAHECHCSVLFMLITEIGIVRG